MRVVWVVGGHDAILSELQKGLSSERLFVEYLIRRADKLSDIPATHLKHPGTVFLLDCFQPQLAGLEGLKKLHAMGAKGSVYLFGEPAPESAIEAFRQYNLAGFFPAMDRVDPYLVAGILHYKLYFSGTLKMENFISPTGKAAVEQIKSLKDFGAFQNKLGAFIGKFGIDLSQMRKVLMGLSLAHVKTGSGAPSIEQGFPIYYGMDPRKVCIAVPAFSKGANAQALMTELCQVLGSLKSPTGINHGLFPEIHHVAKAAENLVIFSGNALAPQDSRDPMMLLATLPFPDQADDRGSALYHFSLSLVQSTEEMTPEEANEATGLARPGVPAPASPVPAPAPESPRTLEVVDIQKILSEPKITGDVPKTLPEFITPENAAPVSAEHSAMSIQDKEELMRLREEVKVLSVDIKRLMKERRQPTTDRELRDAFNVVEEKMKSVQADRTKILRDVELRDKQIEILKQQIEEIKKNKAA